MRRDHPVRRWLPASALGVLAALAALPDTSAAATVDWSQSAVRGVTKCSAYRSPYHPGRGGCYWHYVDKRLESALPKICSLSAPLAVPPVGNIYTIAHASDYANPSRVSPYTGDRGFLGARVDQTITEKFSELKAKFCRGGTTASAGSSGGSSSGSSGNAPSGGSSASSSTGNPPTGSGGTVAVDWSKSAVRGVTKCSAYRSPYHPGRGGCYWHYVDKRLESALPKICSLSAPLAVPPVGNIYTIAHASDYANPSRVSPYTGDRGFLGARVDQTITEKFSELKAKFCRGGTTASAGSSGGSSSGSSGNAPSGGSSSPIVTPTGSTPSGTASGSNGRWLSGMYCWTASPQQLGAWRGRPLEVHQLFASRDRWSELLWVGNAIRRFGFPNMEIVVHVPLLTHESRGDFKGCAAGKYDHYFRQVAQAFVDAGRPRSVVRLGAEFNGTWQPYYAGTDPANYVRCFRRAVDVIRSVAPNLRIEWSVNRTGSDTNAKRIADLYWPGDSYVDIVGLSLYDFWPSAKDEWTWNYWFARELNWWANFTRSKNKKIAFSEWGLFRQRDGFDNPLFIQKMYEFFSRNSDIMSHEILWNCPSSQSQLYPENVNPRAAAVYRKLW